MTGLSKPMLAVFEALAKSLATGGRAYGRPPAAMQTVVHCWFREWATEGHFVEVLR